MSNTLRSSISGVFGPVGLCLWSLLLGVACTEEESSAERDDTLLGQAGDSQGELGLFSGQTGGEINSGDTSTLGVGGAGNLGGIEGCEEEVTVVATAEEVTTLGVSAEALLALAEGEHNASLEWHPVTAFTANAEVLVTVTPETGTSEIDVGVVYNGGEIRLITYNTEAEDGYPYDWCRDRLELDVEVTIRTAGGAFDEHFGAVLSGSSPYLAEFITPFEMNSLSGALNLEAPQAENPEFVQMEVQAQFGADGYFAGRIGGVLQQSNSQVASAGRLELASWGNNPCRENEVPIALEQSMTGLGPERMLARINQQPELAITWADGSQSTLTQSFTAEGAFACVAGAELYVTGQLEASSADGRVNSTLDTKVVGLIDATQELGPVDMLVPGTLQNTVPVAQFEQVWGISGVNLAEVNSAYVNFATRYEPDGTASGGLEVIGLRPQSNCQEDEPNTACSGPEMVALDSATW